jgi:2',3'-cyclic-nucleotide 2'-phosphodiesterase (5'-nucleotidase family)
LLALLLALSSGCLSAPISTPDSSPSIPTSPDQVPAAPVELETGSQIQELTVLYTNDEHGWMAGMQEGQGSANLLGLWKEEHGYNPDGPFLILSGGDNWTGPAISTWFEGQSMVEVMNTMGYAASVIGNHEFDFGVAALQKRITEAEFPYLSANLRYKEDGSVPVDLGIHPYTIVETGGLRVGIIGLTTTRTPNVTNPANLTAFEFIEPEDALREVVPEVQEAGADLLLIPGHLCQDELYSLAEQVEDLPIDMLGGGHCNELFAEEIADTVLLEGGYHFTGYAYVTFRYDLQAERVLDMFYGTAQNRGGEADPAVAAVVDRWQDEADSELNVVVGYLENNIPRRSQAMQDLITETWLLGYPGADVAITNLGGMRDRIPAGEVTLADITGVMPFNNTLVDVKLSGEELLQVLRIAGDAAAIGGAHREGGSWLLDQTEEEIDTAESYTVLVNDFMYAGGDDYDILARFDPNAYNTAIDWRQPVIDWIIEQRSTPEQPLDQAIESLGS